LNAIRYNNFTEFYNDNNETLANPTSKRLRALMKTIAGLDKGCSCSKKSRVSSCEKEYRKMFKLLDQDAVSKLRAAKPDTTYEFSNKEVGVFYVVPATGEPHRTDGG
jgi:hypothetical protein